MLSASNMIIDLRVDPMWAVPVIPTVELQAFSSITVIARADLLFLKAHIHLPLAPAVMRLLCVLSNVLLKLCR